MGEGEDDDGHEDDEEECSTDVSVTLMFIVLVKCVSELRISRSAGSGGRV